MLYEVITSRFTFQLNNPFVFNGLFDASLQLARGIPFAGCYLQNVEAPVQRIRNYRITSYNVCYTKLLRFVPGCRLQLPVSANQGCRQPLIVVDVIETETPLYAQTAFVDRVVPISLDAGEFVSPNLEHDSATHTTVRANALNRPGGKIEFLGHDRPCRAFGHTLTAGFANRLVITSYSIHYTKLYDLFVIPACAFFAANA